MDAISLKDRLSKNPCVICSDNELLFFRRDMCNSVSVRSTGDIDTYNVSRSIRKGIIHTESATLEDVAHLYVEMAAEEVPPEKNILFPDGLRTAMKLCQDRYKRNSS